MLPDMRTMSAFPAAHEEESAAPEAPVKNLVPPSMIGGQASEGVQFSILWLRTHEETKLA